jgi:tRNA (guanine-N7-)-methyltransferase
MAASLGKRLTSWTNCGVHSPDENEGVAGGSTPGARRRGMIYGRRAGHKLRPAQAQLVDELLPRLRLTPEEVEATGNLAGKFGRPMDEIWLEIGFGGGEHLAWQAVRNRHVGFIGIEPFINGIAKLLTAIDDEGLDNVRIYDGDARLMLGALPDGCLSRAFVLFPDPWHKKRHNKRRIVNVDTLTQLHRAMKPGAELRIASDIPDYVRWIMEHARRVPGFVWQAEKAADWRVRPDDWPMTRYEQKALREGRAPAYLSFRRL